jgi:hypothetical protein
MMAFVLTLPGMLALESATKRSAAAAATAPPSLMVATANVREGTRVVFPVDLGDGDDRRALARRMLSAGSSLPDVVLLQEAIGSAGIMSRTLTAHPRAQRAGARYVVAVPPSNRPGDGWCDGRRPPHRIVRDGAILINASTIARVNSRGFVRTWGKWILRRNGSRYDCAEQAAWAVVVLRHGTPGQRLARVANIHTAPLDNTLKSRALTRTVNEVVRLNQQTPRALLVVGGDFKLTRCVGPSRDPERLGCTLRAAHRRLTDRGFVDAVRARRPDSVRGVRHRIDFVYSRGPVASASWDRCYLAFNLTVDPCPSRTAQFPVRKVFGACQVRANHWGSPGGGCSTRDYARYYSDHPVVRGLLRWR